MPLDNRNNNIKYFFLGPWVVEQGQQSGAGMVSHDWVGTWSLSGSLPLPVGVLCIDDVCGPLEVCSASTWSLLLLMMASERDSWASYPGGE